ncbi:hypothetical protein VHEMI09196 [[Torrubiella] hemipterigena]|uniref:Uncharacterized protein n=1 Tax=[Torrubiella] hemipterigena TaxID=1531966 RepID=A0A0A1TPX3_9HYPO|nr:hypothetical protein VHEMI09196 [[Torrubiella] hemipterigena]
MTALKNILFAVAATAVGIQASPVAADSTATSIVGAPAPVVTEASTPLEGKQLEEFLANEHNLIPEGALDVSDTELANVTIKYVQEHPEILGLNKRGGPCSQGDCPDFNAPFDFFSQRFVIPVNGSAITTWAYFGRVNDCGKCHKINTSKDGCWDVTSCGRKQNICVDSGKARAHRIWRDNGHKTCYKMTRTDLGNCGVGLTNSIIWHPAGETACNW